MRKMKSSAQKLRNSGKILSHHAWCPRSRGWKTPVLPRSMVLPHPPCNVEDPTGQSNVSWPCDRAPVLSPSTTMTTSMGRADLANYHHRNLCEHDALVVIVATEQLCLAIAAYKQGEAAARLNSRPNLRKSMRTGCQILAGSQCRKGCFSSLAAKRTQPQGLK